MISGKQLRDTGIDDNLAAATAIHREYRDHAEKALARLARSRRPFTADTVHQAVPAHIQPHHANVLPSLFGHWARSGRIVPIGHETSSRRTRHSSRNRVWIGQVDKLGIAIGGNRPSSAA